MKIKCMFWLNIQGLDLSLIVPLKINFLVIVHTLNQSKKQPPAPTTAAITPSTIFPVLPAFSLKIQIPKSLTEVLYITN